MKIHMVKKGDTLYLIAKKYNVPLEELVKANPEISNPDVIDVGAKVKIPAPAKPVYDLIHQHTVEQGDSLWKLSKAWGVPLSDMIQANPQLKNPNVLLTGEVVNIPKVVAGGPVSVGIVPAAHDPKGTGIMPAAAVMPEPAPLPEPQIPAVQPAMPAEMPPAVPNVPAVLPTAMVNVPAVVPTAMANVPAPLAPTVEAPYDAYHEDHDLFAQQFLPAVEAAAPAQSPALPEPAAPVAYGHYPYLPVYGQDYAHGYAYGYGDVQTPGYAMPAGDNAPPPGGVEGAIGSVYHPMDVSGYPEAHDASIAGHAGYGDISQTGMGDSYGTAVSPAATGPVPSPTAPWQGVSGYLPAYVPGLVAPAAVGKKTAGGCKTCGGGAAAMPPAAMPWPGTSAAPTAGYPAAPYPDAGYPTAVSPAAMGPYIGPTGMPAYQPGAYPAPNYPAPPYVTGGYPTAVSPAETGPYPAPTGVPAYPPGGYAAPNYPAPPYVTGGYPTAVSPAEMGPYPSQTGGPAYPPGVYAVPNYPAPSYPTGGYPTAVSPAEMGPYPGAPMTGVPVAVPAPAAIPADVPGYDYVGAAENVYGGYPAEVYGPAGYAPDTYGPVYAPTPYGYAANAPLGYGYDTYPNPYIDVGYAAPYDIPDYGSYGLPYGHHGLPYGHHGVHHDEECFDISSIPSIPTMPPLRPEHEAEQPDREGPTSVSLHAATGKRPSATLSPSKKRVVKSKQKNAAPRRSNTGRKESLPWMKW